MLEGMFHFQEGKPFLEMEHTLKHIVADATKNVEGASEKREVTFCC